MEQLFHNTCTNGPIPFVARPARAVVRAKGVSTVCIYVTIMTFALAFINVWNKNSKRKFQQTEIQRDIVPKINRKMLRRSCNIKRHV